MSHKSQLKNKHQVLKKTKKKLFRKRLPFYKKILLHPVSIFITIGIGVLIFGSVFISNADSYNVTATVQAPSLAIGAYIKYPLNGNQVHTSPLNISGTCPNKSYIELIRNGYPSGYANCSSQETFQILSDLSIGTNDLQVRSYNITNQRGPSTPSIRIAYSVISSSNSNSTIEVNNSPITSIGSISPIGTTKAPTTPLILGSTYHYRSFLSGNQFHWGIDLKGGNPPYVVTITWGDGQTSSLLIQNDPLFDITHDYQKPGNYSVIVSAVDSSGEKSTFQIPAVISKAIALIHATNNKTLVKAESLPNRINNDLNNWVWITWPTYGILILMMISFWLGEKEEYKIVFNKHRNYSKRIHHN